MRLRGRLLATALVLLVLATGAGAATLAIRTADDAPAAAERPAPEPRVDGNRLVDDRTGNEFVPRGVNWSSFEYACAQGWGTSALSAMLGDDPYAAQAEAVASWGANTVRLPLNQDCWLGTRGAPVSDEYTERTPRTYRQDVHRFVDALNEAGLVVILDLHSRKRLGTPEFGNLAMPDSGSLAFWRSVAAEFADEPAVMFDAFNEPYTRYGPTDDLVFELTWECWRDGGCRPPVEDDQTATVGRVTYPAVGMSSVVATIRDAGAAQPVLLSGLDYANDLTGWLEHRPNDPQVVAAFHSYDFKPCRTSACWDDVLGPIAEEVPVVISEVGAEDPLDGYVEQQLHWADQHDVGALFWVWADHGAAKMALVADETGTPTRYGRLARDWLLGHR